MAKVIIDEFVLKEILKDLEREVHLTSDLETRRLKRTLIAMISGSVSANNPETLTQKEQSKSNS